MEVLEAAELDRFIMLTVGLAHGFNVDWQLSPALPATRDHRFPAGVTHLFLIGSNRDLARR